MKQKLSKEQQSSCLSVLRISLDIQIQIWPRGNPMKKEKKQGKQLLKLLKKSLKMPATRLNHISMIFCSGLEVLTLILPEKHQVGSSLGS